LTWLGFASIIIVKEGHLYSVVFSVARLLPNGKPLSPDKVVALDPNHKSFAYAVGTDGKATEIHTPYFLKALDKRIDQLKSKRDNCKKKSQLITRADGSTFWLPSRRWLMLNARLQEVYRIRREQTKQFLYTVANRLSVLKKAPRSSSVEWNALLPYHGVC
jgi:putative transposase